MKATPNRVLAALRNEPGLDVSKSWDLGGLRLDVNGLTVYCRETEETVVVGPADSGRTLWDTTVREVLEEIEAQLPNLTLAKPGNGKSHSTKRLPRA